MKSYRPMARKDGHKAYVALRAQMLGSGKSQEQRTREEILGRRAGPNGRIEPPV